MAPAPRRQPQITLLRTLWVMTRPPNKSVTAGIYQTKFGRELRTCCRSRENNLLDSLLSRARDEPLEYRASERREVLESQGWRSAGSQ